MGQAQRYQSFGGFDGDRRRVEHWHFTTMVSQADLNLTSQTSQAASCCLCAIQLA